MSRRRLLLHLPLTFRSHLTGFLLVCLIFCFLPPVHVVQPSFVKLAAVQKKTGWGAGGGGVSTSPSPSPPSCTKRSYSHPLARCWQENLAGPTSAGQEPGAARGRQASSTCSPERLSPPPPPIGMTHSWCAHVLAQCSGLRAPQPQQAATATEIVGPGFDEQTWLEVDVSWLHQTSRGASCFSSSLSNPLHPTKGWGGVGGEGGEAYRCLPFILAASKSRSQGKQAMIPSHLNDACSGIRRPNFSLVIEWTSLRLSVVKSAARQAGTDRGRPSSLWGSLPTSRAATGLGSDMSGNTVAEWTLPHIPDALSTTDNGHVLGWRNKKVARSSRAVRNPASVSGPNKQRKTTTKHAQKQQQKHEADTTACGALLNATCGQTVTDRRANSILLGASYARKGTEQHSLVGKRYLSFARKGTEQYSLVGKRYLSFARKRNCTVLACRKTLPILCEKGNWTVLACRKTLSSFSFVAVEKVGGAWGHSRATHGVFAKLNWALLRPPVRNQRMELIATQTK